MSRTLREFLSQLDEAGELKRITASVSPILEITRWADRESKSPCGASSSSASEFDPNHCDRGGRALLFENVEGCDFPLSINTFGSYRRMEMALGVHDTGGFETIARRIASLTKPQPPRTITELLKRAKEFLPLLRIGPKQVSSGRGQQVVKLTSRNEVDLTRLPLIKCWPLDGDPRQVGYGISPQQAGTDRGDGRYITLAGMHTIHADDVGSAKPPSHNIGVYRAQLIDETHLVMHWHMHHDGASHWRSWKRLSKPMPIAICLGGESSLPYAATAPLPPGISELLIAGFLNGRGIPLLPCKTVPLRAPANSEIIIEGWVSTECGQPGIEPSATDEHILNQLGPGAAFEGPFGDHTGFYSLPDRYPIVEITAITHARDAVYPTTIVGQPPQEDYYLGKATERVFLPLLKTLIHDIEDYHLPQFGCFHNCAFVKINKSYPLHARRVMHAIWGAGQMAWTKLIVVVDDNVNVHDEQEVMRAVFSHCHFIRDLELVNGPLDILDHAAPRLAAGQKLGIDATPKISGEEVNGIAIDRRDYQPPRTDQIATLKQRLLSPAVEDSGIVEISVPAFGCGRCIFVSVNKTQAGDGREAIEQVWRNAEGLPADYVVAVDGIVRINDWEQAMFHLCANADPGRDCFRSDHRLGIDATTKTPGDERNGQPVRRYPPLIEMDQKTIQSVDQRMQNM